MMEVAMNPTIEVAPRRATRYWYEDGLVEIGSGLLFLLLAGLFSVEGLAPAGSLPPWFSALGLPVIVLGGMIVLGLALRALKERLTYPRTGYVAYPPTRPLRKVLAGVIGGVVSMLVVLVLLSHPEWLTAMPAVQGAVVAAVWFLLSYRMGVPRMAIQGLLALVAGVLVSLAGLQTSLGTAAVFGAIGLGSLISGAFVLARYLRTTAPPAEEA
jgi:hypothetical protein